MKTQQNNVRYLCWSTLALGVLLCCTPSATLGNPTITVTWDCAGTPTDPADYEVDYTDPSYPDIELKTECLSWKIKSVDGGNPGDIGEITATGASNYGLAITDGASGPGAHDVKKIDLDPSDAAKYSMLNGGSISGDLDGNLFLQKSSGGSGGHAAFTVGGDVGGDVSVPGLLVSAEIDGDVSGNIQAGTIVGAFKISGDLAGSVTVTDKIDSSGTLQVDGNVTGSVDIADIDGTGTKVTFGTEPTQDTRQFAGDLIIRSDIEEDQHVYIYGTLSGSVDLDGNDLAGDLTIAKGGTSISSVTGGTVTSEGNLGLGEACTLFAGTVTLGSVSSGGDVKICQGNLDGTIHITGDMDGLIGVVGNGYGNVLSNGRILIDGDCGGTVNVQTDLAGEVRVGGDLATGGDVLIGEDVASSGNINITGDIDGDVDIDGEMSGNICGDNLDPEEGLSEHENITIDSFGPGWTICDEYGCTCDGASCGTADDCNDNDIWDTCDILEGTSEDCDGDGIPDDGGDCDPTNQDAQMYTSAPADEDSLWRTENNVVRLYYYCDIDAPSSGDVLVQEMLDEGDFDDDESSSFTFTVEDDAGGNPRILKIHNESSGTLTHRKWYAIRNTGDWSGVADFEVQYVVQMGDANNDGQVQYSDLSYINAGVPTDPADDDDRKDINGDGKVLYNDISAANAFIPSGTVSKPSGH